MDADHPRREGSKSFNNFQEVQIWQDIQKRYVDYVEERE
jgi:hypothetical protein